MKLVHTLSWRYSYPFKPIFNWTGHRTSLDLGQIISHSRHILPGQRAICWHERNRRSGSNLLPTLLPDVTRNLQWLFSPSYQHLEGKHAVMCRHAWLTQPPRGCAHLVRCTGKEAGLHKGCSRLPRNTCSSNLLSWWPVSPILKTVSNGFIH